jgi:hypothetical protein
MFLDETREKASPRHPHQVNERTCSLRLVDPAVLPIDPPSEKFS